MLKLSWLAAKALIPGFLILLAACSGGGGSDGNGGGGDDENAGFQPFDPGTGFNSTVFIVAPATDGSGDVYVGGAFTEYDGTPRNYIVRLNSDGTLDTGFNSGAGFNNPVFSIEPARDGSGDVYVGGSFTTYNGAGRNFIARIDSDGSLDAGFDPGSGFNNPVNVIAAATDGSGDIYVGGRFSDYRGNLRDFIARINDDGTNDGSFNSGSGFDGSVASIAPTTDLSGDIYVGGAFKNYRGVARAHIVRINADGSNDGGFDDGSGFDNNVLSVALSTDGSGDIFAGGQFETYRGNTRERLVRIRSDGANEGNFDPGIRFDGIFDEINVVVPINDGSGSLYVGGDFGRDRPYLARINSDGTLDADFNSSGILNDEVFTVAPASDNRLGIYIGGSFGATVINNGVRNRITRLDATGAQN